MIPAPEGYHTPRYDREAVRTRTKKAPCWIHFGAGNLFRAFPARVADDLLNRGILDQGIVAVSGTRGAMIDKTFRPFDDYSLLAILKADGTLDKHVVGSIVETLKADSSLPDFTRLKEIFCNPSLQMASFTITEKGYALKDGDGNYKEAVAADLANGPEKPGSYLGLVASLLYERYQAGSHPIALVSMDNCSHNGDKLKDAICTYAKCWEQNGFTEPGFTEYLLRHDKVAFPWTMIDKITPGADAEIGEILKEDYRKAGQDADALPFVNAEECEYLVIEDWFPNGRPPLGAGGILFTDRETVDKVERMKVGTCLNPLHTALAIFGCLLGYEKICQEMEYPVLRKMVEELGYQEGMPVVTDPGILDPMDFLDTVLNTRLPNPFLPDTPQRIASDTSQKLSVRFGGTLKAYLESDTLDIRELNIIPLVFAGWLRYLMGIDDFGQPMELSPDPMLDTLVPVMSQIRLGGSDAVSTDMTAINVEEVLQPILSNTQIFGVDLYEAGLADKTIAYFKEMITDVHAVEETLKKHVTL